MAKVYCYLPQKQMDQISHIKSSKNIKSQSQVIKELIDAGLQSYEAKEANYREESFRSKHTNYLLRLLSITSETLRLVFDKEKVGGDYDHAEELLEEIRIKVDNYVQGG